MSTIIEKTISTSGHKKYKVNVEQFSSAMEVAMTCENREITDSQFDDQKTEKIDKSWSGVRSYEEALELLRNGHQETVDTLKQKIKVNLGAQKKRFQFQNQPQGFSPIVPLALKGVPNCMIDMKMVPMKSKVVDVYYDMTCSCSTDSEDIINAGRKILSAIMMMEAQGYRFNLYAVQTYSGSRDADMLVVKVKSATQPLDLKRISFPLCHTGFFRVVGFDWYSRFPKGKYRGGYGNTLKFEFKNKGELDEFAEQMFGKNAVFFSAQKIVKEDEQYIKEVLTNGSNRNSKN